jgi:hypothetical protein
MHFDHRRREHHSHYGDECRDHRLANGGQDQKADRPGGDPSGRRVDDSGTLKGSDSQYCRDSDGGRVSGRKMREWRRAVA